MSLSTDNLITILRREVNIKIAGVEDSAYLSMSDEDIALFLKLGASRLDPDLEDLSDLTPANYYPVILLAKIELYLTLATLKADRVDLGADNNNYIKLDQRFQHYMSLVEELREEYQQYLDNDGNGTVNTYDVLLSGRHYTSRNYALQALPKVSLKIDSITNEDVSLRWNLSNSSHFGVYKLYKSTSSIVDMYKEGASYLDKVSEDASLVFSTLNVRDNTFRIEGLDPDTTYYVAIIAVERNQLFGYSEKSFTTLSAFSG